jgi:hypothetical protein
MKNIKNQFLILLLVAGLVSCSKDEEIAVLPKPTDTSVGIKEGSGTKTETLDFSKMKKIAEGDFMASTAHVTTGKAQIYEDAPGIKYLVFDGVKGDNGPDLRLYMATDTKASGFTEVSPKISYGSAYYVIPKAVDTAKQKYGLIWCQQFSVLFGSVLFNEVK